MEVSNADLMAKLHSIGEDVAVVKDRTASQVAVNADVYAKLNKHAEDIAAAKGASKATAGFIALLVSGVAAFLEHTFGGHH